LPKECAKCGKKVRWLTWKWEKKNFFPELFGKELCAECTTELSNSIREKETLMKLEKPFKEGIEQGKRIVTINDSVLSEDGIGKHLKLYTDAAQKYGYSFISLNQTPAQYVIFMAMVFEIKEGLIPKFVNCSHCQSRYNSNEYFKCPNCGAISV
jgi:hypothetical protein